jgi:CRP-like cAMP-binding protein
VTLPGAERVRAAARQCEGAGLLSEADLLYRVAADLELEDRARASSSLARVLLAAGARDAARKFVEEGSDPVLAAGMALEAHDFALARSLLDEARERDPFDPRTASARGRLSFFERRFSEAVGDLLEAALLRPDARADAVDSRFLRAARVLAPADVPPWKEAAEQARRRLEQRARRHAPDFRWPERFGPLIRGLITREAPIEGVLDAARRLGEIAALADLGDRALLHAVTAAEPRRVADRATLYETGERASELYLVIAGSFDLVRDTPVGPQKMGTAAPGDFVGEEAMTDAPRTSDARAQGPSAVLGFTPDSLLEGEERAAWLRHLRRRLAHRVASLNELFESFFPGDRPARPSPSPGAPLAAPAGEGISSAEKSRSLTSGGLSESDRYLFGAFADERRFAAETEIFREGDKADAIYAVARGRVRISRQLSGGEEALTILGPGELFGELAILDPESPGRTADARAHEDCVLLVLARDRFEALERTDPEGCAELSALFVRLAARRAVETAERLARWRILAGPS